MFYKSNINVSLIKLKVRTTVCFNFSVLNFFGNWDHDIWFDDLFWDEVVLV